MKVKLLPSCLGTFLSKFLDCRHPVRPEIGVVCVYGVNRAHTVCVSEWIAGPMEDVEDAHVNSS